MKCVRGVMRGVFEDRAGDQGIGVMPIACGSWKCEKCREPKAKLILARAMNGGIVDAARVAGFRETYFFKTLALTCPGREWRRHHTREEAAVLMRDAFRKMMLYLRRELGYFSYIRVTEDQQDGYPHYHVILCGENIAPKWVLPMIQDCWCAELGMGFVKLHKINSVEKAIKYVIKYLFKDPAIYEELRLFSASRGALQAKREPETKWFTPQWAWGNFSGAVFSGACFKGRWIKEEGGKVQIYGACDRDLWALDATFDSDQFKWGPDLDKSFYKDSSFYFREDQLCR